MNVVFLGPPGAGKGTQAKVISQERGVPHISTGDILREAVAKGTDLGKKAKGYMDSGALVPDELVVAMVGERISREDARKGFILDGFPRNIKQAEELASALGNVKMALDAVVYFKVNDEQVIERLSGRRTCRACGAGYHVKFMPSAAGEACEKCGGELYQRDDDKAATIKDRLKVYYAQTADLIQYYSKLGLLKEVDAMREPAAVTAEVRAVLNGIK